MNLKQFWKVNIALEVYRNIQIGFVPGIVSAATTTSVLKEFKKIVH